METLQQRARIGYQQIFTLLSSQRSSRPMVRLKFQETPKLFPKEFLLVELLEKIKSSVKDIAILTFPIPSAQPLYGVLLFEDFIFPNLSVDLYFFTTKEEAESLYTKEFLPPRLLEDVSSVSSKLVKDYLTLLQYYWIVNIPQIINFVCSLLQKQIQKPIQKLYIKLIIVNSKLFQK